MSARNELGAQFMCSMLQNASVVSSTKNLDDSEMANLSFKALEVADHYLAACDGSVLVDAPAEQPKQPIVLAGPAEQPKQDQPAK